MEDALGAVPILKLNDQVFCQTDAIVDWAADKAGLYSSDSVRRMKKMIAETVKEVQLKAMMAAKAIAMEK